LYSARDVANMRGFTLSHNNFSQRGLPVILLHSTTGPAMARTVNVWGEVGSVLHEFLDADSINSLMPTELKSCLALYGSVMREMASAALLAVYLHPFACCALTHVSMDASLKPSLTSHNQQPLWPASTHSRKQPKDR
jgi:hypothetical protein